MLENHGLAHLQAEPYTRLMILLSITAQPPAGEPQALGSHASPTEEAGRGLSPWGTEKPSNLLPFPHPMAEPELQTSPFRPAQATSIDQRLPNPPRLWNLTAFLSQPCLPHTCSVLQGV